MSKDKESGAADGVLYRIYVYNEFRSEPIDVGIPIEDTQRSLAGIFPEVATASIKTEVDGEKEIVTFQKRAGTKGSDPDEAEVFAVIPSLSAEIVGVLSKYEGRALDTHDVSVVAKEVYTLSTQYAEASILTPESVRSGILSLSLEESDRSQDSVRAVFDSIIRPDYLQRSKEYFAKAESTHITEQIQGYTSLAIASAEIAKTEAMYSIAAYFEVAGYLQDSDEQDNERS